MAKAKTTVEVDDIQITSDLLQTTENLLDALGSPLPRHEIEQQVASKHSIYRNILKAPARALYNDLFFNQYNDVQFFCQEMLVNIIFVNHTLTVAEAEESILSRDAQNEVNRLQEAFETQAQKYSEHQTRHQTLVDQVNDLAKKHLHDWRTFVPQLHTDVLRQLQHAGVNLNDELSRELLADLDKLPTHEAFNADVLKAIGNTQLSPIEYAVVGALQHHFTSQMEPVKLIKKAWKALNLNTTHQQLAAFREHIQNEQTTLLGELKAELEVLQDDLINILRIKYDVNHLQLSDKIASEVAKENLVEPDIATPIVKKKAAS